MGIETNSPSRRRITKMPHPSPSSIADAVRRWMAGATLDERERAIVDTALAENKAAQLLKIYERGSA